MNIRSIIGDDVSVESHVVVRVHNGISTLTGGVVDGCLKVTEIGCIE